MTNELNFNIEEDENLKQPICVIHKPDTLDLVAIGYEDTGTFITIT
jgi:hypothetical protein